MIPGEGDGGKLGPQKDKLRDTRGSSTTMSYR